MADVCVCRRITLRKKKTTTHRIRFTNRIIPFEQLIHVYLGIIVAAFSEKKKREIKTNIEARHEQIFLPFLARYNADGMKNNPKQNSVIEKQ